MHELGLCEPIVAAALRRADGRRVAAVGVAVGALHRAVPESMALAFELVSQGTPLEGAAFEMRTVGAQLTCRGCDHFAVVDDHLALCPSCHGADVRVRGGQELAITHLRYQET